MTFPGEDSAPATPEPEKKRKKKTLLSEEKKHKVARLYRKARDKKDKHHMQVLLERYKVSASAVGNFIRKGYGTDKPTKTDKKGKGVDHGVSETIDDIRSYLRLWQKYEAISAAEVLDRIDGIVNQKKNADG